MPGKLSPPGYCGWMFLSASTQAALSAVRADLNEAVGHFSHITLLGGPVLVERFSTQVRDDVANAERLALPITAAVLLVAFLSVPAALLPVAFALIALVVTLGLLSIVDHFIHLSVVSLTVASVLTLGLGIDFSLFTVMRFREQCASGSAPRTALSQTVMTTGKAIVLSGTCIGLSLLSLYAGGVNEFQSMAIAGVTGTFVIMVVGLTFLPALVYLLAPRLESLSIGKVTASRRGSAFWGWIGQKVSSHPLAIVFVTVLLLVFLSLPALSIRLDSSSFGQPRTDDPAVKEARRVAKLFGIANFTPVEVLTRNSTAAYDEIESDKNFTSLRTLGSQGNWTLVSALLKSEPNSLATRQSIGDLRDRLDTPTNSHLVGGLPASRLDLAELIRSRTPLIVLLAILPVFLALVIGLKSLVIPLKAVLGTLLSVGATLGILAALFPAHPGQSDLGFLVPVVLFVVVFGLSIDYEVFLLSRVRESVLAGQSTAEGVTVALVTCARSLTLAGICMAIVFAALVTSSLDLMKQLGIGIAVGVLIDITIVRCTLIPAAAVLLGKWNWWLPGRDRPDGTPSSATTTLP